MERTQQVARQYIVAARGLDQDRRAGQQRQEHRAQRGGEHIAREHHRDQARGDRHDSARADALASQRVEHVQAHAAQRGREAPLDHLGRQTGVARRAAGGRASAGRDEQTNLT